MGENGESQAGPARRRSSTKGVARPHRTVIRHTDEEWARVTAMAQHLGVSVPGFYERAAFAGSAQAAVELSIIHDKLDGVRLGLSRMHTNLNQIAKGVNIDGTLYADQFAAVLERYETLLPRLDALLAELPGQGMQ